MKSWGWILIGFVLLVGLGLPVHAVLTDSTLPVFAVAPDGTALTAYLNLHVKPGTGEIWSSVSGPLVGTATQSTEKIAVKIAENFFEGTQNYDYFFSIDSQASVVDGPSAGSAMALLVIAALQDKPIPSYVGLTGTITNEGLVGPVGGVFEKAQEAAKDGIKLFLIPLGESRQVVKLQGGVQTIQLPEYALEEWGMKVIEVGNMDDVLKYAYADLDSLDVTQINPPEPEVYIPPKVQVSDALIPLGEMNTRTIKQTREIITQAQNALSNTLLDDIGLIDVLLRSLSDSEKTVNEAELLTQNGYYYSAGNFVFLAKVNAYFVLDVAANPGLLDLDSEELDERIETLLGQIELRQKQLDKIVPTEGVEWYIAAQQRLTWAQESLEGLRMNQVVTPATIDAEYGLAVERVQDYEFARAWVESAVEFYSIGVQQSTKGVVSQVPFVDYYEDFLNNANQGLTLIQGDASDAQRRLNAAIIDQEAGRHLSAAMNAASALALINAELMAQDDNTDLRQELEERIETLSTKLGTNGDFAWARLYLDHAKFYLNSANHYRDVGQGTASASNIRSGLSLVLLADYTYTVTKDVEEYYASLPAGRFTPLTSDITDGVIPLSIGPDGKGSITIQAGGGNDYTTLLLVIAIVLAVFLVGTSIANARRANKAAGGPVSASDSVGVGSEALVRVDELEARLFAAKQGLRHAQYQHAQGTLSKSAFGEVSSHYQNQIRNISKELRSSMISLRGTEKKETKLSKKTTKVSKTPAKRKLAKKKKA